MEISCSSSTRRRPCMTKSSSLVAYRRREYSPRVIEVPRTEEGGSRAGESAERSRSQWGLIPRRTGRTTRCLKALEGASERRKLCGYCRRHYEESRQDGESREEKQDGGWGDGSNTYGNRLRARRAGTYQSHQSLSAQKFVTVTLCVTRAPKTCPTS